MTEALTELADVIVSKRADAVVSHQIAFGELSVTTTLPALLSFMEFLRDTPSARFSTLVDITAVDRPELPERFEIVYHLLSMYQNQRIRIKVPLRVEDMVPSLVSVFSAANWFEREVFDMFGILFSGHPDLRRILTDYGFRGHPLRKDFPTSGYTEVRYDDARKRVVYEPVSLVQEYRQFDFMSPWEGADYILPSDGPQGGKG